MRPENVTETETRPSDASSSRHVPGLANWEKNNTPGRRQTDATQARDILAEFFMSEGGRLQWLNDLVCV